MCLSGHCILHLLMHLYYYKISTTKKFLLQYRNGLPMICDDLFLHLSLLYLQVHGIRKCVRAVSWSAFDWALPEEAQCARPSSNFCISAAIVRRANSTDSAAGWKSTPLFHPLPGLSWKKLEEGRALPGSSGRGQRAQLNTPLKEHFGHMR